MVKKEPEILSLKKNEGCNGQIGLLKDVVYSRLYPEADKLHLLVPWSIHETLTQGTPAKETPKRPLIVFVQGSGWTHPDVTYELPQLVQFAKAGYIVALAEHRNCLDGFPAPAFLEDVKTAIRFLRKNADLYGIDGNRTAIWGTSSGANTALLAGLTGDLPEYKTEEYPEYSDSVQLVVSCFAPTDLTALIKGDFIRSEGGEVIIKALLGDDKTLWEERAKAISPLYRVTKGKEYPPFLLLHGDADALVSYSDNFLTMVRRLAECGADVQAYRVEGAPHEGEFWGREVYDVILDYLNNRFKVYTHA